MLYSVLTLFQGTNSVLRNRPIETLPAGQPANHGGALIPPGSHSGTPATSSLALLNMSNLINQKDSRWLQLEVCREFQRNKCSRSDNECKFAHPTSNVEVQNGRVTACYDSIKVRITFFLYTLGLKRARRASYFFINTCRMKIKGSSVG